MEQIPLERTITIEEGRVVKRYFSDAEFKRDYSIVKDSYHPIVLEDSNYPNSVLVEYRRR